MAPVTLQVTVCHFRAPPVPGTVQVPSRVPVAESKCSSIVPPAPPAATRAAKEPAPGADSPGRSGREIDRSHLDGVVVFDGSDVAPTFAAVFDLDAWGPSQGLALDPLVGIQRRYRLCDSGAGLVDRGEGAIRFVREFFDGNRALVPTAPGQLLGVIEEVGVALEVNHAGVVREGVTTLVSHDDALVRPGPGR